MNDGFDARLAWCQEMAKAPDYFLVDGQPPFTNCPSLRERQDAAVVAQAEIDARAKADLEKDLATWNEKTIAPARAAIATDVVEAARLIGRGFQGQRQSQKWDADQEAATFIAAELKPKVDELLAALPTSHGYADALVVLDEMGRACRKCAWVAPTKTSTREAWATHRAKNADVLAAAGKHGHAFVEFTYLADNGQAAAAAKATAERARFFAGNGLTVVASGADAASTEAARRYTESLTKTARKETLIAGKGDARVKVEVVVGAAKCNTSTTSSTRTVSVTRGKKQVESEDYGSAQKRLKDAEKDVAKLQDDIEDTQKSSSCRSGSSGCDTSLRSLGSRMETAQRELRNASEKLSRVKPTREVDNVVEASYPIKVTTNECRAPLEVKTTVKGSPAVKATSTVSQSSEDFTTAGFPEGNVEAKSSVDVIDADGLTAMLPAAATGQIEGAVKAALSTWAKAQHEAAAKKKGQEHLTAAIDAALVWPSATTSAHADLIARETGLNVSVLKLEQP